MITIAQLTDLHLPMPDPPGVGALLNKRVLGFLSWKRKRYRRHRIEALNALVGDLKAQKTDLTLITGDIVNIALPDEFSAAKAWMEKNFTQEEAAFVPGNHDTYIEMDWADGIGVLSPYMTGERMDGAAARPAKGFDDFPYIRRAGNVAAVMVNSSPSTAPGMATGRLGPEQIDRIGEMLKRLGDDGCFRIVALHHPAVKGATFARKSLLDQPAFEECIKAYGAELIIHGHMHNPVIMKVDTPRGPVPVVGAGSASHPSAAGHYRPAQYNLYHIEQKDGVWSFDIEVRELVPDTGECRSIFPMREKNTDEAA